MRLSLVGTALHRKWYKKKVFGRAKLYQTSSKFWTIFYHNNFFAWCHLLLFQNCNCSIFTLQTSFIFFLTFFLSESLLVYCVSVSFLPCLSNNCSHGKCVLVIYIVSFVLIYTCTVKTPTDDKNFAPNELNIQLKKS